MALTPFSVEVLDGSNGFTINGENNYDNSGRSVSNAGDVNGDGIDDLLIGAPNAGGYGQRGRAYVVFGTTQGFDDEINLSDLDGSNGFAIDGIDPNDSAGRSVSNAGDINGDGIDDLAIVAPYADRANNYSNEGEAYVVFGSSEGFDSNFELSSLLSENGGDGSNGVIISGISQYGGIEQISNAGDVNGDGIDDLIFGASGAEGPSNNSGVSYVVYGQAGGFNSNFEVSELNGSNGFSINGADRYDGLGNSVSNAGDINGDGIDDLIVGASRAGNEPGSYSAGPGQAYVVFGSNSRTEAAVNVDSLNGNNGFTINGIEDYDYAGFSVSNAGDINGDGFDDLVISANSVDRANNYSNEGEVYVLFGRESGLSQDVELSSLLTENGGDGSQGFVIQGIEPYDQIGLVSNAGDVNGDGIDDLIIGAPDTNEAYVIFGSSDGFDATLDLENFNGSGLQISSTENTGRFGSAVSNAGDINGDGIDDFIIGAPYADPNGYGSEGQSYVIFGVESLNISGTDDSDVLNGGNGDDTISGRGGGDIIRGQNGNDNLLGGDGADRIIAGGGDDTVFAGRDDDVVFGNAGNDEIFGNNGRDDIFGGEGDDFANGGNDDDRLFGEAGNDNLLGGNGADSLFGESGDDTLNGGNGEDTIDGGSGDDVISGGGSSDSLIGGTGNDRLSGNGGADTLIGVDISSPSSSLGRGELDTLTGNFASDTFVLGNENGVFYDDGDALTRGEADAAIITDFDANNDFIQLSGSAEFYSLDFFTTGTGSVNADIIFDAGIASRGEVIATLENASQGLTINDPSFIFV